VASRLRVSPLRRVLPWLVVVLVALGLLVGRVVWSAHSELAQGRAAFESGDREAAVVHLNRAAHWYAPGNPYVTDALDELLQIARQAEMEGQVELALAAYRAIRSSCLGTRSFYTPHADRLRQANRRIAGLMARQTPAPMDRSKLANQRRDEYLALLENVEEPHPLWSILACLSFLVWVGGVFGFILRAFDSELALNRRAAARWGSVVLVGLGIWVVSLLLA